METESKTPDTSGKADEKPADSGAETGTEATGDGGQNPTLADGIMAQPSLADKVLEAPAADKAEPKLDGNGAISPPGKEGEHAHHVYKLLDEVLDTPPAPVSASGRAYRHPILVDCLLCLGLLVAMGGFTIGMIKIYITHSAEQSITQRNYKAAIAILRGAPLPGFFTVPGKDPEELLNQAFYLDAMDKLDANGEDESALTELQKIEPGSRFFDLAQEILKDHTKPSATQLEGQLQHAASPDDRVVEDKTIPLPEPEKDGSP